MVSRYVPDMGDLIWFILTRQKVASKLDIWRPAVRYVSVCSLYNAIKRISVRSMFYPVGTDGVALADQVKSIAWRARGSTKKGTVAPEELQLIKAKINVLIG